MSYATQQDMVDRFGESDLIKLTDRADPPLDAIDAAVLNARLADAQGVIDSYVATRYTLPLTATPLLLRQIECDLAWYLLQGGNPSQDAKDRNDAAMRILRDVSAGKVSLGPDSSNTVAVPGDGVTYTSAPAVFTPDTLSDY